MKNYIKIISDSDIEEIQADPELTDHYIVMGFLQHEFARNADFMKTAIDTKMKVSRSRHQHRSLRDIKQLYDETLKIPKEHRAKVADNMRGKIKGKNKGKNKTAVDLMHECGLEI